MKGPEQVTELTTELVRDVLEANLGKVVRLERQARWRPAWFATLERDGGQSEVCVRGARVDALMPFSLHHEMTLQGLMHAAGIPVAEVHLWSEDPEFYVMDRLAGKQDFEQVSDANRRQIVDEYLEALVRLHQLDVAPFVDAGIFHADDPARSGVAGLVEYERTYRETKVAADPVMEFALGWLRRNPVDSKGRQGPVVWDSGQFHHDGEHLVGLLDLELGHVGDPMIDLGAWRMRGTTYDYGRFDDLYARYAELSGEPVDLDAIEWHHTAFTLSNQLSFHRALIEPTAGSNFMMNLYWCALTNRMAMEAIAEKLGVNLETLTAPEPAERTPITTALAYLVGSMQDFPASDESTAYEARAGFRLARHLQRFDEIGPQTQSDDLDDLEDLLGERPRSWLAGEDRLERFVLADGGRHDAQLVRLFNRRTQRLQMLLGPVGSAMAKHHRTQPFRPPALAAV
jgi:aminoglycoside phosphotransferase (APT) family kinase protein